MPMDPPASRPESPTERAARGKAARASTPRSCHADWEPSAFRHDPVALLEEQARSRLPELVPIRTARMLVSPLAFYRGAAAIMASDLAAAPHTGLVTQLCGDAHLANFGGFAAPDRRLVFGIDDFDETLPGPFEWDVKRLAASVAIAGRDRGFDDRRRDAITRAVGRSYREAMRDFAAARNLELWYARIDVDELLAHWQRIADDKEVARMERNIAKARAKDSLRALGKLTALVNGERRFVADPPLVVPIEDVVGDAPYPLEDSVRELLRAYQRTLTNDRQRLFERFRYVHAARRVVGVGSVGTRAWVCLLIGRDADDPLFLQLKQAEASVLERHLGHSALGNHGQRVVEGQRLCQGASDILLGWIRAAGVDGVARDFYVRQLWDAKGSASLETMTPRGLQAYAQACASELARAHARAGDAIAIASYLGTKSVFERSIAVFAEAYADQNERDYRALQDAVASGRITADTAI